MQSHFRRREVAASATLPVAQALQAAKLYTSQLPSLDQLSEANVRIGWDQFTAMLRLAEQHFDREQIQAIGGLALASGVNRSRVRLARRLLTLEDAYRFIMQPQAYVDYACVLGAVETKPGHISITAMLLEGYAESETFFQMLRGAIATLPKLYDAKDVHITANVTSTQLQVEVQYRPAQHLLASGRRMLSRWIQRCHAIANLAHTETQLARRTFALQRTASQREQAKKALAQDRADQARRMQNLTEVMVEYDHLNQVVYMSPNGEKIFGYPNNLLLDDPLRILPPQLRASAQAFFANPRATPNGVYPMQGQHANGQMLELEVAVSHFDDGNGKPCWIATFRDVSSRKVVPQTHAPLEPYPAELAAPFNSELPTLLLADDDEVTRRIATKILNEAGYQVIGVEDGQRVLGEVHQYPLSGLILDINMPGLSGIEVYEQLQSSLDLPVIFISGDAQQLSLQYPELPIVSKPFRSVQLIKAVRELIAAWRCNCCVTRYYLRKSSKDPKKHIGGLP